MDFVSNEFNNQLFNVYVETNRYEDAIDLLNSYLTKDPNNSYYIFLRAYTLYLNDDYNDAISSCVNALNNGYSPEDCQILLGRIYLTMEQYNQSEKCLLDALSQNPENAEALALYSIVLLSLGYKKKAAKFLENAMEKDPNDPDVLDANYRFFLAGRNKGVQIKVLDKIMTSGYSEAEKLVRIALFYQSKKDYKTAKEYIRQAYLMAPNDKELLLNLIELEIVASNWNLPMIWVSRIGGPIVIWLAYIVLLLLFIHLQFYQGISILFIVYTSYVLYSHIATLILRSVRKRRLQIDKN